MGCAFPGLDKDQEHMMDRNQKRKTIDIRRRSTKVMDTIIQNIILREGNITGDEIQFAVSALKNHQLFESLKEEELLEISRELKYGEQNKNEYLFHQGDNGHSFFIIYEGSVEVIKNKQIVNTLTKGQSFGELALLFKTLRNASIKCTGDTNKYFILRPAIYNRTLEQMRRKSYEQSRKSIDKIQVFKGITNKQKTLLSNCLKSIVFKPGDTIFEKGDLAHCLYIIETGSVNIVIDGKDNIVLQEGDCFGEGCINENGVRAGKAVSEGPTECLLLCRRDIESVLGRMMNNLSNFNLQKWGLMRSKNFKDLPSNSITAIILEFEVRTAKHDEVIQQGIPQGVYTVLQGKINQQSEGSMLCEEYYHTKNEEPTMLIKNGQGSYAYVSFQKIDQVLNKIQEKKNAQTKSQKNIVDKENLIPLNLKNFEYLMKLGEGQFGQVYLVKDPSMTGSIYAIKQLDKKEIKKEFMEECVLQEKNILEMANFNLIVGYVASFHDPRNIFFLMEYIQGKEMFDVIREISILNKTIARFYFGSLLLSIEYLHQHNIVYRDIKPQNSIVNFEGRVYLIDLGTAKILNKDSQFKTFTIIGTPHYMAPEVFEKTGYSFEADFWSLGILLYEFICGLLPYGENMKGDEDPFKLYVIIKKSKLEFPPFVTDTNVKNVISTLLTKNPSERAVEAQLDKIKEMPYFSGFDWNSLAMGKMLPPYIPRDFKGQPQKKLHEMKGSPFFKQLYKGQPKALNNHFVAEWNGEY